ncbi:hypothetical protein NGF19_09570 [Streptomyces sp. RY43-2]|uniref:Uncharacterized protein n=1 Tax=Streptomyces macrolidinus TaxID=2952607 RepID=A0ABT0ZB96_9ACTN|nr:hypothetical protein [Streptomyces macrolidinus]MCN9241038.1 hypothetical protein [Streptomyces macrolidinus]
MTDRRSDRQMDDSGHIRDMTEETLGAQEQARQELQHQQEQERGRPSDETPSPEHPLFSDQEDDV